MPRAKDESSDSDPGSTWSGAAVGPHGGPQSLEPTTTRSVEDRVGVRKAYKMYVGGAFVRSESGRYTQVPETAASGTDGPKENVPRASRKDARDAVVVARAAWDGWAARTAQNRGQILYRLAEMLEARQGELCASLERSFSGGTPHASVPVGTPHTPGPVGTPHTPGLASKLAAREVAATIDRVLAYAGWTDKYQSLFASLNPVAGPHFNFTVPEPMGVVAIVAPARPALLGLAGAILPVIASGNTAVVLASEADPRTAVIFAEALATSDLPGGVVNVLTGQVSEVLPHLAKHMEIAALDLHGLDAALQRSVEEAATINVKRVRARSLDEAAWFDAQAAESPRWIERFVEMKTIWHPAGP